MRWSRHADLLRDEPELRVVEQTSKPSAALALIDEMLRIASGRDHFSRAEGLRLLHRVEMAAHESPARDRVASIVDEVDRGSADRVVLSRLELVDPLLEIRLALAS
jgi:hypothetical protein